MFKLATNTSEQTFENFKVTKENRLANAAALAVAEKPGGDYNPFYMYSTSETSDMRHLLNAIGNRIEKKSCEKIVLYATGKELAEAVSKNNNPSLFEKIDILLLENIQDFVENHFEDLKQILEKFTSNGKQIVITSNVPPKDLPNADFSIITQLNIGMVVGIEKDNS